MIFSGGLCEKVLNGSKTQTRRPVKLASTSAAPDVKPCPYKVGQTYAVQPGRGQHALGRILVKKVDRVAVCVISTTDAIAEGFGSGVEFMDRWRAMYGDTTGECWRIEFELVEGAA